MKLKLLIIFIILLYAELSCKNRTTFVIDSPESSNTIEIDYNKKSGVKLLSCKLIDSVKFIQLETNIDSKFLEIKKIAIAKERFVIFDEGLGAIFIFNKQGRFLSKIDSKKGQNAFKQMGTFYLSNDENFILFKDLQSEYIFTYDLDSKFISKRKIQDFENVLNTYEFSGSRIFYNGFNPHWSVNEHIIQPNISIYSIDSVPIKSYLPFNTQSLNPNVIMGYGNYLYLNNKDELLISQPLDFNIYSLTKGLKFSIKYHLNLSDKTNPFERYYKQKIDPRSYINSHPQEPYGLTNCYTVDNTLIFTLRSLGVKDTYLFKNRELISLKNIIWDTSTHFLPTLFNGCIAKTNDGGLVSTIPSNVVFFAKEYIVKNNAKEIHKMPQALQQYFKGSIFQNPILAINYLKTDNN